MSPRGEYDRLYYAANRDRRRAQNLVNYYKNRDVCAAHRRDYRAANRAAINLSEKTGLPLAFCRKALDAHRPL